MKLIKVMKQNRIQEILEQVTLYTNSTVCMY